MERTIAVSGGRVTASVVGDADGVPLVAIHGGPGATRRQLSPLFALGDERPVATWDQLGCGRSERPHEGSLWTLARFVEETAEVVAALDITDLHLFGHSWGGALAVAFVSTKNPVGLRSLTLSSPLLDVARWESDAARLRSAVATDAEFMSRHFCRSVDARRRAEPGSGFGRDVYGTMWGESEIACHGTLRGLDLTAALRAIRVPTLVTCGRHDITTPEAMRDALGGRAAAQLVVFEDSAHLAMLEEEAAYVRVVREFLRANDQGSTSTR